MQAKYCEGTNGSRIAKEYVLEDDWRSAEGISFSSSHAGTEGSKVTTSYHYLFTSSQQLTITISLKKNATGTFYEVPLLSRK